MATPVSRPPPAPRLDQESTRRDTPALAEALDRCAETGHVRIDGEDLPEADGAFAKMRAFEWGRTHVVASREA